MNSGMSFSGWWYGPYVFEPRVTTASSAVGDDVAPDEQLAGRLGRRVRRARRERRVLGGVALVHGAVDLVGRDLQEARPRRPPSRHASSRTWTPMTPGREERLRIEDGAVDVRLGGEVDDRVRVGDERPDRRPDRRCRRGRSASRAGHLGVVADGRQVGLVAGVGQLVEDGDPRPVAPRQDIADVARADEPGPAGDQQPLERARLAHLSRPAG